MIGSFRSRFFYSPRLPVTRKLIGMAVLFLSVLSTCSGCNSKSSEVNQPEKADEDRCEELIRSALDMIQPDRFGITSDPEAAIGVLNQWSSKCAASIEEGESIDPEVKALLNGLIAPDEFNLSTNSSYHKRDVEHIRDCLLYKELVETALKTANTDLGRTVELFEFVTRNIALLPKPEQSIPLSPYEIILFGRGTSQDRAWIFANLLRQLRIDAVILRPQRMETASDEKQKEQNGVALPKGHWLVGTLLDDKVYLFDMRLGLPIPSKHDDGKSVTVRTPASLSEVLESDAVFRKLDIDSEESYPLKSDDFRNVQVEVIGNGSFWFPRMKRLQISMTGESVLIYDGLEDGDNGDGLFARIAKQGNGRWERSDISFWSYPEKALQNSATRAGRQRQIFLELHRPFDAPLELKTDRDTKRIAVNEKTGELLIDQPSRKQLKTRTDHIMGQFDKVIPRYQMLRWEILQLEQNLPRGFSISPETRQVHGHAQEDAFFWTGACQIEQGEFSTAAETLGNYLNRYGLRGVWTNQAIYLRSLSFARNDKLAVAMQILRGELEQESIVLDPLQRLNYQFLINRWRTLGTLRRSAPTRTNE